ncbi:MAG: LysR family transcriptional regulator [Brachybacterium sp.]|uniref:LysR family transcriptional regulator n=1 Tax=Brachybacterium sp. TaxID=1891286 RepID=UPI0026477689|nr:LysR family transcriptional regulator [Brachybacterium sp.]MDN5688285.1 LysR family transcriptional regulator [Brachybacterium sp.]
MEYVVALAEERHFTRAADLTGISQSGLSSAIRSLEAELDTPLFHRTTRKVEPTAAGYALVPHARAILEEAVKARDAVVRVSRTVTGSLRVGAEQCLGFVDVSALLERFHRRYPLVETEFVQSGSHELVDAVRTGSLDVAFVATSRHLGAVRHMPLGHEPLVVLLPPSHPLAALSELSWDHLDGLGFVDFGASWGVRTLNDESLAAHGISRRVRCSVNDVHTLLDLVRRGLGIAIVPQHVAAKPQADELVRVSLPGASSVDWTVSAISPMQERADIPAGMLLELLGETCPGTERTDLRDSAATGTFEADDTSPARERFSG